MAQVSKSWQLVHDNGVAGGRWAHGDDGRGVLYIRRSWSSADISQWVYRVMYWQVGHARGPISVAEFPSMKEAIAYAKPTLIAMRLAWPG